ncbi:MAG: hypothetical protein RLZZ244_3053 [Verrucomicrobiota bacterium]
MNRSLRMNILAGALGMFWLCAPLGAPLPLLMQAVEASATQLGILSAAWQIAMLAQIPSAFLAESQARRKPLWAATAILHRILWATPALLPWLLPDHRPLWPALLIAALGLSNLLANVGTASWQSWMADIVPPASAGRFWAIRQMLLSVGLIAGTALYGWLLDHTPTPNAPFLGFQWVFGLCSLLGIADILVHCLVEEPPHRPVPAATPWYQRLRLPFQTPGFPTLTAAMAAWIGAQSLLGYTLALPGFFSMVHLRETFGASYSQASLVFIAAALGAILFTPWLGPWMDRAGAQNVLSRLVFIGPLTMAGWWLAPAGSFQIGSFTLPKAIPCVAFAALFQGAAYTGTLLCQFRLTQMYTPSEGRTVAMAVHWSLTGIAGASGALAAGLLKDTLPSHGFSALGAHWQSYDLLVLIHLLLAWSVALPLCNKLAFSRSAPQ